MIRSKSQGPFKKKTQRNAVYGVMSVQASGGPELPATSRSWQEGIEQALSQSSQKKPTLLTVLFRSSTP